MPPQTVKDKERSVSEWTAQEDRRIDALLYNIIFYIYKELIMKNLIVLSIIIVISLVQMLFKSRTIQTCIVKKAKEGAKGESDLFSEINCTDTPQKRTASDMLHPEYKCYKFFFKMPPNKQGPKSVRYSEYQIYQTENRSVTESGYHFFTTNECSLRNLVYYLDYGDTLIEIQNDAELIDDAQRGERGWQSQKIKTGKIYELDSMVFRDLLEKAVLQTASLQLTEKDIKNIRDIMEKLVLHLSIANVFWLEHFLKTEYDFELAHDHKAQIANFCIASLSRVIYNNRREQATNIIAQLEEWLVK